jgi:hypothetical protein
LLSYDEMVMELGYGLVSSLVLSFPSVRLPVKQAASPLFFLLFQ